MTLVGYSLGARVVFSCLKELAKVLAALEECPEATLGKRQAKSAVRGADAEGGGEDSDSGSSEGEDDAGSLFDGEAGPDDGHEGSADRPRRSYFFSKRTSAEATGASPPPMTARELRGLVQDVVLLGAPINLKVPPGRRHTRTHPNPTLSSFLQSRSWAAVRGLVCGRLVNGYSRHDKVLSVVYRYSRLKVDVGGIGPVAVCAGVENADLSDIVDKVRTPLTRCLPVSMH